MKVHGEHYRSIRQRGEAVEIIDQTRLPHAFEIRRLQTLEDAATAIRDMWVRGAPLIGATAAWGVWLALRDEASDARLQQALDSLLATRPTAVNLRWALQRAEAALRPLPPAQRAEAAAALAQDICDEDVAQNEAIGEHGLVLIEALAREKSGQTVHILTHCNAGWLATVDWGTALAPIYKAHDAGLDVHVWVDETRPRNQGAGLTAWELQAHGVPFDVIVDNAGGHLMQQGLVDLCLVGTDRTTANGDVCNKIGTYLKALAARDNGVPFHVCLPGPTIDWQLDDGMAIPIEQRGADEVRLVHGLNRRGEPDQVDILPAGASVRNDAFDVTPARLVSGLITERGRCRASREGLLALYPEQRHG